MTKFDVVAVRGGKFSVQMQMCPGSDEMIEVLTHAAKFTHKANAESVARRMRVHVQRGGFIVPAHWLWDSSPCSPYQFIQTAPTATAYDVNDAAPGAV